MSAASPSDEFFHQGPRSGPVCRSLSLYCRQGRCFSSSISRLKKFKYIIYKLAYLDS